jgi:hypothetical protein
MTFSVTALPHYQGQIVRDVANADDLRLDEDQGSWFGMLFRKNSKYRGLMLDEMLMPIHEKLPYSFVRTTGAGPRPTTTTTILISISKIVEYKTSIDFSNNH